jgi:hypothetical protein
MQAINKKYNDNEKFMNLWKDNISELFSYLKIMNFFIKDNLQMDNTKLISKIFVEREFNKFLDIKNKYGNKIFIEKNLLEENNIKIFVEFMNLKYDENKRVEKYNDKFKIKSKEKEIEIDDYCKNMALDSVCIKNALRLYENFKRLVEKQKEKINSFKSFYPVFTSSKSENIIKCFLESYLSNLSVYSNGKLKNIIFSIEILKPEVSLIYLPESICFYGLKTDAGPIGLTIINKNLLNDIIPTKILRLNSTYFDLNEFNLLKTTLKYKYNPQNINSMNNYIDSSKQILKIRKYKLKTIKN